MRLGGFGFTFNGPHHVVGNPPEKAQYSPPLVVVQLREPVLNGFLERHRSLGRVVTLFNRSHQHAAAVRWMLDPFGKATFLEPF